jgi:hypothetical protein
VGGFRSKEAQDQTASAAHKNPVAAAALAHLPLSGNFLSASIFPAAFICCNLADLVSHRARDNSIVRDGKSTLAVRISGVV